MPNYDVVIIGSGIAALTAAYQLLPDKNVIILTKSRKTDSNSNLAQGGVAASIGKDDSWFSHYSDTLVAGCNHNREETVEILVKNGPIHLLNLIKQGMKFDLNEEGNPQLGKEGAHSTRRILHANGDSTGRELVIHMLTKLKDRVPIIENEFAIDLLIQNQRCVGVETMDSDGAITHYFANHIILATGGYSGLYSFTSNDESITGDGIAMAYRAGCELTDMEFIQFHPTLLLVNGKGCGLISEAVRGEGAILVNDDGKQIMKGKHPFEDLAPRDIVARAIYEEMNEGRNVFLDISMIDNFENHFPTITSLCKSNGIEIEKSFLPVTPGAHFSMGGIKTDARGRTSIQGLYAVGEVACTGAHGANRLASNSLLEGIVFGHVVAEDIKRNVGSRKSCTVAVQPDHRFYSAFLPTKEEIQSFMMENVGIIRTKEGLQLAISWFESYMNRYKGYPMSSLSREHLVLFNMITVGWLIATSALVRTESRGGHFREDYPFEKNDWLKEEIIRSTHTSTYKRRKTNESIKTETNADAIFFGGYR